MRRARTRTGAGPVALCLGWRLHGRTIQTRRVRLPKGVCFVSRRLARRRRIRSPAYRRNFSLQLEWPDTGRSFRPHPQNDAAERAGRLTRQQDADVLAFMLSANKFPAGKTEVYRQSEMLKEIRFESEKPADKK